MTNHDNGGIGIRRVPNITAQTTTGHSHCTLPSIYPPPDDRIGMFFREALPKKAHASKRLVLSRQLLQQSLRLLQITRVEPLSEPPVDRSEQFARLLRLALVAPKAREAHGGAEFPARATRCLAFSSVVQLKVQEQNSPSCL